MRLGVLNPLVVFKAAPSAAAPPERQHTRPTTIHIESARAIENADEIVHHGELELRRYLRQELPETAARAASH